MRFLGGAAGVRSLKLKLLYISSSVGLGHVTRDLRLSRELAKRADITWLTAGRAAEYLAVRGERLHELSPAMKSLGKSIENVIRGCRVRMTPWGLLQLYRDLRHNANIIRDHLDLEAYDLIVCDEPWELMLSGVKVPYRSSVLITDITRFGHEGNESWVYRKVNSWLSDKFSEFRLKFDVGLWGDSGDFLRLGQIMTHEGYPGTSDDGPIVINVGGTGLVSKFARSIRNQLNRYGMESIVIGGDDFVANPLKYIADAKALVTLAGYGSLVEAAALGKRAVILTIDGHFEHEENALLFKGRQGYRVMKCSEATADSVASRLGEVIKERPSPPRVVDATHAIASNILRLADEGLEFKS